MQNVTISGNTITGVSSGFYIHFHHAWHPDFRCYEWWYDHENKITDIRQNNTTGYAAAGITLGSSSTNANLTVSNNFISDVSAVGNSTASTNGHGIYAITGGGYNIYHNSEPDGESDQWCKFCDLLRFRIGNRLCRRPQQYLLQPSNGRWYEVCYLQ